MLVFGFKMKINRKLISWVDIVGHTNSHLAINLWWSVEVLFENLVLRYLIVDMSFDVRREGKKVFFKMLNYGDYLALEVV